MTAMLDAARRELQRGRQPIPVPLGRKKAILDGWPKLRLTDDDLAGHFSRPTNLAILNGEPSSNQVDVDLDCREALVFADVFLPPTRSVFGRPGKPRSHRLYIADPLPATTQFRDTDGTMLVEVRSTGSQTVFPPSIHPDGEVVSWVEDGDPAVVSGDDLTARVGKIAAASILARHWPAQGSRHDAALAVAGGLLRLNWDEVDVAEFIEAVADAAGDEETRDRAAAARYTAKRLKDGNTATGWRRLGQFVGDDVVSKVREWLGVPDAGPGGDNGPYVATSNGIIYRRPTQDGPVDQPLSNFTASIVEEVVADDGVNERGELAIEGTLAGGIMLPRITVPINQFTALDWPIRQWGTRAIVAAGSGTKDRLREAIQRLSPDVPQRRVYEHPGWREIPDMGCCYLHAGGAIGAHGSVSGVDVTLSGTAASIMLPEPPSGPELRQAVRASLNILSVAPDAISVLLLAAVYRAVLCAFVPVDHSIFLVGPSGVYKSELGALVMQHVGETFDRLHLPTNWTATENFLEGICFKFKDAPVVIDDFAPTGSAIDVQRLHAKADRVLRSVGNRGGRGRMNANGSLRPDLPPRGLVIGTGEDAPKGHSLRARMVIREVAPGDVDTGQLSMAQVAGRKGDLVAGLAGYVQWVAAHIDALLAQIPEQLAEFRIRAQQHVAHARTPDAVAHLALGWWIFLRFAVDVGVLTRQEAEETQARVWQALGITAAEQAQHQIAEEPARRFIDLLGSALAAGQAHIAASTGGVPDHPEAWGWRKRSVGSGAYERTEWQSQGDRAGWVDGNDLYLDTDAALTAVQRVGQATGSPIGVTPMTLAKRLHERGFLRSADRNQGELKVRRMLEGRRLRVLHLSSSIVLGEYGQYGQSGDEGPDRALEREVLARQEPTPWPDSVHAEPETGQEIRPNGRELVGNGQDAESIAGLEQGGNSGPRASAQAATARISQASEETVEWEAML
jgi:hypothetical protein